MDPNVQTRRHPAAARGRNPKFRVRWAALAAALFALVLAPGFGDAYFSMPGAGGPPPDAEMGHPHPFMARAESGEDASGEDAVSVRPVPEPASLLLIGGGLMGTAIVWRRRRTAQAGTELRTVRPVR